MMKAHGLTTTCSKTAGTGRKRPVAVASAASGNATSASNSLHSKYMRRALALAETARGKTYPNPMVGCVIVNAEDEVVGEGFHPAAGQPHAEVFALRAAGNKAAGATAYVTLEPCNHYGRTPPCSLALVAAGVSKVVVGMVDPNPLVGGSGLDTLTDNGIEVLVGVEEEACRDLNVDFIERMEKEAKT